MTKEYAIEGMTCGNCVASVKDGLEKLKEVRSADVQLAKKKATLTLHTAVPIQDLQQAIGKYKISNVDKVVDGASVDEVSDKSLAAFKPLLLIIGFILLVTILSQYPLTDFSIKLWMRHFMAGFFIVFSFFKLLNLEGFASSYGMYDIVAKRWKPWAYLYPFIELGLGVAYLINFAPIITNWLTIVVLGLSSIGVIQSVLDKRKIKCACLGDVFNLPISTVTIIEDVSMVLMAAVMLF